MMRALSRPAEKTACVMPIVTPPPKRDFGAQTVRWAAV